MRGFVTGPSLIGSTRESDATVMGAVAAAAGGIENNIMTGYQQQWLHRCCPRKALELEELHYI